MRNLARFISGILLISWLGLAPAGQGYGAAAGPATLVKDITPGIDYTPGTTNLGDLTSVGDTLYFAADDGRTGVELWKLGPDGTPALVKDIAPGPANGLFDIALHGCHCLLTGLNGLLYFMTDDGIHGFELWRSDGTEDGTVMVRDFNPGPADGIIPFVTEYKGQLYFGANTPEYGYELWRTDDALGAVLVKDVNPGPDGGMLRYMEVANGMLYFFGNGPDATTTELWRTDGTAEGTVMATEIPSVNSTPEHLQAFNSLLVYHIHEEAYGWVIWVSDGTPAGTHLLKDINPGPGDDTGPVRGVVMGDFIYFNATDGVHGNDLWRSDGSAAGTSMVADLQPDGGVSPNLVLNDVLYFSHYVSNTTELWRSDGSAAGTTLVKSQFDPGRNTQLKDFTVVGDDLYFIANETIWRSDGTPAGTVKAESILNLGLWSIDNLTEHDGMLYFSAANAANGVELWRSDGTAEGTRLFDISHGPAGSIEGLVAVDTSAYFTADDGVHGRELWRSDGTPAGTAMVKDIQPGPAGGATSASGVLSGTLYFAADDGEHGLELWRSDGSGAGTAMVKDIQPGSAGALIHSRSFVAAGAALYFVAEDPQAGEALWRTDGTEAGTVMVKDPNPGPGPAAIGNLTAVGAGLFFSADDGVHGAELWRSDGSAAGTAMVKDIKAGAAGAAPERLAALGGRVVFAVGQRVQEPELWVSDGSAAGTSRLGDMSLYTNLTAMNNAVYFTGYNGGSNGLWRTDGLAITAVSQDDVRSADQFTPVNNLLYFTILGGEELWRTDGSAAGTWRVSTTNALNLANINNVLYFAGQDEHGYELWRTDGSEAGIVLVQDIAPGFEQSRPRMLTEVGETLLFVANDQQSGPELWSMSLAPDTTPPVISVPDGVSVTTGDPAGAAVQYTATATDARDPSPSLSCAPTSGSMFPLGATTVTCTASDVSGNTASATFTVTVALRRQLYLPRISR
jgi:ELWxxDGT repeat protein